MLPMCYTWLAVRWLPGHGVNLAQHLDLAVNIPLEAVDQLSSELKKRDMLVPSEIIQDSILEDRADIPINAIHMYSGYKADLYPLRVGDELRTSAFERRQKVKLGRTTGEDLLAFTRRFNHL